MKKGFHVIFAWLIILSGLALLIGQFSLLNIDRWRELAGLVALIIVTEWYAVSLPQATVSGGFAVIFSTFIIYGAGATAYVAGLASFIACGIANRGDRLRTILFNAAQYILAVTAAGKVYLLLGGAGAKLTSPNLLPLAAFVLVYYLVNHLCVYLYYLPERGRCPSSSWGDALHWDALTYLVTVPMGLLMALLYGKLGIMGSVLLFLPVIVSQFFLRLYVNLVLASRKLRSFYRISAKLPISDLQELLDLFLNEYSQFVSYHTAVVYLWRQETNCFVPTIIKSPYQKQLKHLFVYLGEGYAGRVAAEGQAMLVKDCRKDSRVKGENGLPQVLRSLLVVPLASSEGVCGLVVVGSKKPDAFDHEQRHVLTVMAAQVSVAVANAQLANRLQLFFDPKME